MCQQTEQLMYHNIAQKSLLKHILVASYVTFSFEIETVLSEKAYRPVARNVVATWILIELMSNQFDGFVSNLLCWWKKSNQFDELVGNLKIKAFIYDYRLCWYILIFVKSENLITCCFEVMNAHYLRKKISNVRSRYHHWTTYLALALFTLSGLNIVSFVWGSRVASFEDNNCNHLLCK